MASQTRRLIINYAIAIHGGAGAVSGRDYSTAEDHLRELAGRAQRMLAEGASALDTVELVVTDLEACGLYVAGRGSAPNSAGYVELDASIMAGPERRAGAVAGIRDVRQPIAVARAVMERTPHVMLAGAGALAFARAQGFEPVGDPDAYYVLPVGVEAGDLDSGAHGTVGAVARDKAGRLAAATSTGGTFGKLEGRIGDTPLIGAGTWADDTIAVSCTGTGEYFIRAGAALAVATRVRAGEDVVIAVDAVLADVAALGGDGGIIAVTAAGEIAMRYNSEGMKRAAVSATRPLEVATFG